MILVMTLFRAFGAKRIVFGTVSLLFCVGLGGTYAFAASSASSSSSAPSTASTPQSGTVEGADPHKTTINKTPNINKTDKTANKTTPLIKIGVLAFRGKQRALQRWTPTAHYLTERITGYRFEVVPYTLEEMEQAVKTASIDFMITNSGNYITLSSRYGGSRLVTLKAATPLSHQNVAGSVIFTRSDRTDIQTLEDIRGKKFLSVAPEAFCFQTAWHTLKSHGIEPWRDFAKLLFAGFPQDYIAKAVLNGTVDVGNVRTGVLEAMAAEGKLKLSDLRILEPKRIEGFPYLTTTKVYPEWPFARLKHTDRELSQKVAIALMQMSPTSKAARIGEYAGWTVPLDYRSVHDLFRDLKIGPYKGLGELTFASFLQKYWMWFAMAVSTLLISWIWALRTERVVQRRTRELAALNATLAEQIKQREIAEQAAAERQAAVEHLARQNALGEMAATVAHDLNHPLATILNYVNGCNRKLSAQNCAPEDIQKVLKQVEGQAAHAAEVIKFMVGFLRKDPQPRELTGINRIIHEIISILKSQLSSRNITLELDLGQELPPVLVDAVQIEQVLLNLIRNAMDAMANTPPPHRLAISSQRTEEGTVEVAIRDTGCGIPQQLQPDIFKPFVSAKIVRDPKSPGPEQNSPNTTKHSLGLGLSISRSIIEKHGGKIWLERTSDQGSEFRFSLPCAEVS